MILSRSTSDLRVINRGIVLKAVARGGSVSRQSLAQQTGLTTAAISRITRQLLDAGLLTESTSTVSTVGPGRRSHGLKLSNKGAYLVVMVFSANRRSVAVVNCNGDLLACKELDTVELVPAARAIATFCDTAKALLAQLAAPISRVLGVSVVVAVSNNPSNHKALSSEVLGWHNIDLKTPIENALALPVHLEARSVALLQAEIWQTGLQNNEEKLSGSVFLINNGWRLGSSVFVKNNLLEVENNRLGQVAHLALPANLEKCYCGRIGCLDALASGEAIVKSLTTQGLMDDAMAAPPIQKLVAALDLAKQHRAIAKKFNAAGQHLGQGLNIVNTLFAPQSILLAGATARQPDYIAGVKKSYTGKFANGCNLASSTADSLQAATRSGLNAFVFSEAFNLQQLEQAPLSA